MLLLITLFAVVAGIFVYSLRADTGENTKHARNQLNIKQLPRSKSVSSPNEVKTDATDSAHAA